MKKIAVLFITAVATLALFYAMKMPDPFNPEKYDASNVITDIERLASSEFEGRQTGTPGNRLAMDYVKSKFEQIGLDPIEQPFIAQIPFFDASSIFTFLDEEGKAVHFSRHEDYKFIAWGPGGSIEYTGDLVFADDNVYKMPLETLKGKVVVTQAHPLIGDSLQTIIDAGAVGILYYEGNSDTSLETYIEKLNLEMGSKTGNTIGIGYITRELYLKLKNVARLDQIEPAVSVPAGTIYGYVHGSTIKQKMTFQTVNTANILATIEGKSKNQTVIITAHLDHVGTYGVANFFPGALDNASGVAALIEIAKSMKTQYENVQPDKTVIFAALNAGESDQQGVGALIDGLGITKENVQVIALDRLGGSDGSMVQLSGSGENASIPLSKIALVAQDINIPYETPRNSIAYNGIYEAADIPAITISHGIGVHHQMTDTIEGISQEVLSSDLKLILQFVEATLYSQNPWQVLSDDAFLLLAILAVYLFIIYALEQYKDHSPRLKGLYLSAPVQIAQKLGTLLTPITILILLIVITKLPRNMDVGVVGGALDTNFSPYLTFKHTFDFIRMLLSEGIGNLDFIKGAFLKSALLFIVASTIALVFGIIKGLYDAYSDKENSELRSFMSITALSVPDIMWILLANYLMVLINKVIDFGALRAFIFPLITLSIMPMIYVSRMSYLAFSRERMKPYFVALKSRGISKFRIFTGHLILPVLENALTAMTGLASVMISNLIIVEYLFDYKGLANFVLIADKSKDEVTFISLIAAISILYILFTGLLKGLLFLTSARRKGGAKRV